ncbi:MAG TPA: hypothetical protein VN151_03255, partial [Terracidiphilus sp.]|nr:hypothetical protein [Terracidiphilus sp.]
FATATSICRRRLTICSGVCFFPRAIPGSSHTSFSDDSRWYKIRRALQIAPGASWLINARKDLVEEYTALGQPQSSQPFRAELASLNANPAPGLSRK